MPWWFHAPPIVWCLWVFALGLIVGSFLNVAVARLPAGKSVAWPGSRCFTCLSPLRSLDNLPIMGYLRLRGRCRFCGASFSSRYLWVELSTGLLFLGLFAVDVLSFMRDGPQFLSPWYPAPGLEFSLFGGPLPPLRCWVVFLSHAAVATLLLCAALIDAEHFVIPPSITYLGALAGVVVSTLAPWPWPSLPPAPNPKYVDGAPWFLPDALTTPIPQAVMPWPVWGPPPAFAPAGSWQLGLLSSLAGAAVGTGLVRSIKWLFETAMRREALGLGDADLLLMAGAFFGWQVVAVGFFAGTFCALALRLPSMVRDAVRGKGPGGEMPFGPGLALGVVLVWLAWPRLAEPMRVLFEPTLLALLVIVMAVGLFASGLLLRRPADQSEGAA